jgi:DNA helicase-2/ATP-dependent DNA helicase PcrA
MSLSKEVDGEPLIVDWRSPVASVYYDGRLGVVTYTTPSGTAGGDLQMKRQYTINDGVLEDILDVDITTTDTFLQAALGESKDNKLKDIVSTIQAEQNEIIRADILYPLIVQGAAGSGKTTIALHRIAYLIYTYEDTFEPYNFLIVAPNRLFLNYISEVLPELGAHHVKQSTFTDLVYELSGIKVKLSRPDDKLKQFISHGSADEDEKLTLLRRVSSLKGSLVYRDMIDSYISDLEQSFVPEQDFKLRKFTILSAKEIRKMFLVEYSYLPMYQRIPEIKKKLAKKLKGDAKTIVEEIQNYYDKRIEHIRTTIKPSEKRRQYLVQLMSKRDEQIEIIKKDSKTLVNRYLSYFPKHDVAYYFNAFIGELGNRLPRNSAVQSDECFISYMDGHNQGLLSKNSIEFEDLASILYLKHRIFGVEGNKDIKYVVLDEAQDFSLFQVYVLKYVFKTELFTMLGDVAQGIHSYRGINDWEEVRQVFTQRECRFLTLEQSYRTTIEIMNAANEVLSLAKLPGLIPAKPVVRHGDAPGLFRLTDKEEWLNTLENKLAVLKTKHKTIAVICKTDEECDKVVKKLVKRGKVSVKRLHEEDISYEGGIVILPTHLAKGLEFDAVVIAVFEDDFHEKELDIKLLYVAMTRALHSLDIICYGAGMALLDNTAINKKC